MRGPSVGDRALRALFRLYPRDHREAYGAEMLATLEHARASPAASGWSWLALAWDLARGAAGVWVDRLGRKRRRRRMGGGRGWMLDARFLMRSLWGSRGYVVTAVAVLACAVAVNAAVLSYVRGTLLDEPPYPDPERVMIVWGSNVVNGQLRDVVSGPSFLDLRARSRALSPLAAFDHDGAVLMLDGGPQAVDAINASVGFFEVLGVAPAIGRLFEEQDRTSSAEPTVVVTHAFWRDQLGSRPDAVGYRLHFQEGPRTVIGVLPEGFEFISPAPLFLPLRDDELAASGRMSIHYHVLGRLVPGASVAEASREAAAAMAEITAEYPSTEGWGFLIEPLHEVSVAAVRPVILILSATVGLVLFVALVNLTTLFRIRAFRRADELGLRAALGAGRAALLRVLVMETGTLAVLGAGLGLALTPFLLAPVTRMVPTWIAIPESAARVPVLRSMLDPGIALGTFAAAVLGALVIAMPGFAVALRRSAPASSGGRVRPGMRGTRFLVAVELTVATTLCIGAGLTARSAANLTGKEVGVEAEGLLTVLFGDVWDRPIEARVQYFRDVVEAVEAIPGVERAGVTDYVDFLAEDDFAGITFLDQELQPRTRVREEWRRIDAGFMETSGTRVIAGRGLELADTYGKPRVALVNESFAAKHYPDGDALGRRLSTHEDAYEAIEIVGIVEDVRSLGPATPAPPMLYAPNQGAPRGTQGLYVRVNGDPMSFAPRVRDAVKSVDPSQPIAAAKPMTELVASWVAIARTTRTLVVGLASLAWLLSAVGAFGVVAYALRTRRAELGIRLALGATPDRLEVDQLRAIAPVVVAGVGAGLALGVVAARSARSILFEVSPADPVSLVLAVTAMSVAAPGATYLPARRAVRVDPRDVIRTG